MPALPARTRHLAFTMLFIAIALVFFATVAHHAYTMDFRPLAAFCLPVLAVFFTFTSLLYIRGNSVAERRNKVRTLFAAETAMRATLCYLMGVAVGGSLYGLFELAGFAFDPLQPHWNGLWLMAFAVPYALMMLGVGNLIRAACMISPQFLRRTSAREVWRRVDARLASA